MSLTAVPTIETLPQSMILKKGISSTDVSMIISYVPAVITKGLMLLDEGQATEERIGFDGVTNNGDGTATLAALTRGMSYSANDYGSVVANKFQHLAGCTVRLVFAHEYFNAIGFIDRANTWALDQTLAVNKHLYLGGNTSQYLRSEGTELYFKSSTTAEQSLAALAAGAGTDHKFINSSLDTTASYLSIKLLAGDGISLTTNNSGGNETLTAAVNLASNSGLEITSAQLRVKTADSSLARSSGGLSAVGVNPIGGITMWPTKTAPALWLLCYGQAVSRTTYASLFAVLVPTVGTATMTIASPAVVTKTAHGLKAGDQVYFETTGALPTGVSADTIYYVLSTSLTVDTFKISATAGGSVVNTSGSQSGTHTLFYCPYGLGNGTTTFNVPDMRSRVPAGYDLMGGGSASTRTTSPTMASLNEAAAGEEKHQLLTAEMASHSHSVGSATGVSSTGGNGALAGSANTNSSSVGSDSPHNNLPPYLTLSFIIFANA